MTALASAFVDWAQRMDLYWSLQDWAWGLFLIGLTIAIHATGVVLMAVGGMWIRGRLETRQLGLWHAVPILIGLIGAGGLLLAALHGIEAAIWAGAYLWLGAFNEPLEAMLYSVDLMTTLGGTGVILERRWQMMGALEAADGVLLFGISTAFMFTVMQAYWSMLMAHRH